MLHWGISRLFLAASWERVTWNPKPNRSVDALLRRSRIHGRACRLVASLRSGETSCERKSSCWSAQRYSNPAELPYYPTRLLQFSNPSLTHNGQLTGDAATADNAHTLRNLLPGTAAFRTRPDRIFVSGFDEQIACPGITYYAER